MSSHISQWRTFAFSGIGIVVAIVVCWVAGGMPTASSQCSTWWFSGCSGTADSFPQSGFLMGWASAMVLLPVFQWCIKRLLHGTSSDGNLYGLDHALLNIEMPPKDMWMNMGYWEVCQASRVF
jgi:hypothetical protein